MHEIVALLIMAKSHAFFMASMLLLVPALALYLNHRSN